ncbi:hypothetical protein BC834DRAFT_925299 [Gloeopeniophorella convolvens]|nr:hypothetical protein BC834DRAFT_925299 [Gloeopeniophorella convolvens]
MLPPKLPSSFKSLYRLFLRTTSASVLHHRAATRHIRQLWKPTFREAATVVCKIQHPSLKASRRARNESWLHLWEQSVDRTLALLSTSAQSRGLANNLTRNLSLLHFRFQFYQQGRHYGHSQRWQPQQGQYRPAKLPRPSDLKAHAFDDQCWGALEETVRMAEGKSGLSLGRMVFRRQKP